MGRGNWFGTPVRLTLLVLVVFLSAVGFVSLHTFEASSHGPSPVATYSRGVLRVSIPYHSLHTGSGQFAVEVLSPEDEVLDRAEQRIEITEKSGHMEGDIQMEKPLGVDDLVWHRIRYRFQYDDAKTPSLEGIESISQILLRPVVHILGQQSYIAGGQAAVRVTAHWVLQEHRLLRDARSTLHSQR
jgi:hypothetical protein